MSQVCNEQCPLDKKIHLCTQTENGVSARAYQTCLHFAKALAYFRGHAAVEVEDLRQLVPWVLHEKLVPNARSPFFESKTSHGLLQDRVAWIRRMFDMALEQHGRHEPIRKKVRALRDELDQGLQGVPAKTVAERHAQVSKLLEELSGSTSCRDPSTRTSSTSSRCTAATRTTRTG